MIKKYKYTSVLTIAGSDSGGGAGIQADLKTFGALGCYGTSAITAVTVQNTLGVTGIHSIPAEVVGAQIRAVMNDIRPLAIKIGMVHSAALAHAIAGVLREYREVPVVFDPVMVSTSGHCLIEKDTIETLKHTLFSRAMLITPNLDEAGLLANQTIETLKDMKIAARTLVNAGCNAVLLKGGHLKGPDLYDVYADKSGAERIFRSAAIDTNNTHGTGCTLSAAIAAYTALGESLHRAIEFSKAYVQQAIFHGCDVQTGQGNGPLNHLFNPQITIKHELE